MIRIAICDDDHTICTQLENIILEFQKENNKELTIKVFYSGEKLIEYIKNKNSFDLIFLDIELEGINGVEVGSIIRNELEDYITKIVYISSKSHYDRQLFEVQPLHFLEKPLEKDKVIKDINLAIKILEKENHWFSFNIGHELHKVPIKEIVYFESLGREIKLVGIKGNVRFYDKIGAISKKVSEFRFMQPHRSYLINYDHVISLKKEEVIMSNEDKIPLSRLRCKEIRELQIFYEEDR